MSAATLISPERIRAHYDRVAKWHHFLCGDDMHHGYWEADASMAVAQERLTARLAGMAAISPGTEVLDIGCGLGGSAFWLAQHLSGSVLGITTSYKQAALAPNNCRSRRLDRNVRFTVLDANILNLARGSFDIVWVLECAEHVPERDVFIQNCTRVLKPDGNLILLGWTIPEQDLLPSQQARLNELCSSMLCYPPPRASEYLNLLRTCHLDDVVARDWTTNVSPTPGRWLRVIDHRLVRPLLRFTDIETRRFVDGFRALDAYRTGALRYMALSARKK